MTVFLDTNVVVYAVGNPSAKRDIALSLLASGVVLSVQIVNETGNALLRKQKASMQAVNEVMLDLLDLCDVLPVKDQTIRKAISLRQRFNFSHWDSLIVAAASLAGCDTLYSEDMQDGLVVEALTIKNPFNLGLS